MLLFVLSSLKLADSLVRGEIAALGHKLGVPTAAQTFWRPRRSEPGSLSTLAIWRIEVPDKESLLLIVRR
jgi:hypothetical protein